LPLFERLHEVGCERDVAGNRDRHLDEHCCWVLLLFFNPIVDLLRALQQASELKSVHKKLSVPCVSLGSFSESRRIPQRFLRQGQRQLVADPDQLARRAC